MWMAVLLLSPYLPHPLKSSRMRSVEEEEEEEEKAGSVEWIDVNRRRMVVQCQRLRRKL